MKKVIGCCLFISLVFCACWHNNHRINISVKEKESSYQFSAVYNENKTAEVLHYINKSVSPSMLFGSTEAYVNATTQLYDGTRFYIKSHPGYLKIRLDKGNNSTAAYERIKEMCNGLKTIMVNNP